MSASRLKKMMAADTIISQAITGYESPEFSELIAPLVRVTPLRGLARREPDRRDPARAGVAQRHGEPVDVGEALLPRTNTMRQR